MKTLTVMDALVEDVQRVRLEDRPSSFLDGASLFAVFGGDEQMPELAGLITMHEVARFPNRIFADLLPRGGRRMIGPGESVESAVGRMNDERTEALAVVGGGKFFGAVTRESLFAALLGQERALQAELRAKQAELRAIFDAIPDFICCLRADGTLLEVSGRVPRLFTAEPGQMLGRRASEVLSPEVGDAIMAGVQRCLATRAPESINVRLPEPGHRAEFEVRIVPFGADRVVCVVRDATELNQLKAQLVFADRMIAMGTLAAGVAHEINNPLMYVTANVSLLKSLIEHPDDSPDRDQQALTLLEGLAEGAGRIQTIVRDLRTFTRSDDAKGNPVDVLNSLRSALRIATPNIRPKARLETNFEPVPPVIGSDARLGQVFLNLLINATQAIPAGTSSENVIRVSVRREGDMVRVTVADTGRGLTSEARARLFEAFFTTKGPDHGTGLGLFISNNIVTSLGGRITVEDNAGGGTAFHVELPVADEAVVGPPAEVVSNGPMRAARVLVVDDEPRILEALPRLLAPHAVVTASSGKAALQMLPGGFDVILCDLVMPEMSGAELFAQACVRWPELRPKFLFLTGGMCTDAARAFIDSVGNPVLEKPVSRDVLLLNIDLMMRMAGVAAS